MDKEYSNIKFVSRAGNHFDTKFSATVDVKTITGMLWYKKESISTVDIYSGALGSFKWLSSGEYTPLEVDRLIDIHNHSCPQKERLTY